MPKALSVCMSTPSSIYSLVGSRTTLLRTAVAYQIPIFLQ